MASVTAIAAEDLRREAGALSRETTELRRETEEIRRRSSDLLRYIELLINLLEVAGVVDVKRNPKTGEILTVRTIPITHPTATARGMPTHDREIIPRGEQNDRENDREAPL